MSLDDPNVIAGIANDGTPFFSNQGHHQTQDPATGLDIAIDVQQQQQNMMNPEMGEANMDTPMPMKRGSGQLQLPSLEGGVNGGQKFNMLMGGMPTPGRDADTRELRDFWKQYMRTPLSGPGPSPLDLSASPANGSNNNKTSPTSYRRPRVASLPSAKTPIVERDSMYSHMAGAVAHHHLNRHDDGHSKLGPTSSMRTTLHGNAEDLRSYEAAVLARKAPTRLNLQVRRPAKTTLRGGRSESGSASAGNSPHVSSVGVKYVTSRPGSAVDPSSTGVTISNSSSASSLANAFGGAAQNPAQRQARNDFPPSAPAGRVTFAAKEESVSPSLSSRASSADIDDNGASSEMEALRPSFKRLPSQTLGPANSKRAYYGMGDESENDRVVGWGSNDTQNQPQPQSNGAPREVVGLRGLSHPDRVVASIAERRRRMSAPSSSMAPLELGLAGAPNHGPGGSGGVDVQGLGYAPAAQGGLAG
ncbi:hypothetical protein B0H34DRAFT_195969 [Crassisporium funariophilum]|nr:hypothetical protein B0H34DRAFT_195969 [Crassisporium funariophilum]